CLRPTTRRRFTTTMRLLPTSMRCGGSARTRSQFSMVQTRRGLSRASVGGSSDPWLDRRSGVRLPLAPPPSFGRPAGVAGLGDVTWVGPRRVSPAVLVVVGETPIRQRDHAVEGAGAARVPQGLDANVLMVAGVVGFVQAVATPEFATDRVPQELHDFDPLLVADAV